MHHLSIHYLRAPLPMTDLRSCCKVIDLDAKTLIEVTVPEIQPNHLGFIHHHRTSTSSIQSRMHAKHSTLKFKYGDSLKNPSTSSINGSIQHVSMESASPCRQSNCWWCAKLSCHLLRRSRPCFNFCRFCVN